MSVAGIYSSNLFNYSSQTVQNQRQQLQQEFQQLGQDLQSGSLSSAQLDLAALEQNRSTTSSQSSNPITQEFNQLSKDLSAGNLSGAQQDYSQLQQDFQSRAVHGHHHHHSGGGGEGNSVSQLMSQLGQALQAGNLTSAQQAYSSLMQDLPFGQTSSTGASQPVTVSVSA